MKTLPHLLLCSKERPVHLRVYFLLGLAIVATLLASTTSAVQASTPILHGYRDFTYPTNVGQREITAAKPESKLWWNDGHWWGNLWSTAGNSYHIYRLNLSNQTWIDTGVAVDGRTASKADALWDGSKLYIVSHIFNNGGSSAGPGNRGQLYRYSYNAAGDAYSLDSGFPVDVNQSQSETLVLAKDSTGTLWVTYVVNNQVMVNHSLNGDDADWGTPYPIPVAGADNVNSDDISSIIAYDNHVGVMWSDQSGGRRMSFAAHADGDGDAAADWQGVTAYGASGDDHINLKSLHADPSGKLFAIVKTSSGSALIVLLVCDSGNCTSVSDWDFYNVYNSTADPTRPMMIIDEDNRDLYIFARVKAIAGGDGEIFYKKVAIDNIHFDPNSAGEPFIASLTERSINDPTSTKQNVNSATGLIVLASDPSYYFHGYLDLSSPGAPSITSFTPASGTVGTEVTVTGSNFIGASAVRFNGTDAIDFEVDSDTQIRAIVPAGATSGLISVTNPDGTGSSATHFTVLPDVDSFTPLAGPAGTEVTISGSGFNGVTAVSFNGTPAVQFTLDSDTQIRAIVPAGATTGPISVTNPAGTGSSATHFTVTVAPSITSFTPLAGSVGTEVTITGSNFNGATAVRFNGIVASSFVIDSDTQIRATVPAGATTGPISVTNAAGTANSATNFTVVAPVALTIGGFIPTSGPVGTVVTISGAGFGQVTEVRFNGALASGFIVNSDTQIQAIVPAGATTGPISVKHPAGTATSAASFEVVEVEHHLFLPYVGALP